MAASTILYSHTKPRRRKGFPACGLASRLRVSQSPPTPAGLLDQALGRRHPGQQCQVLHQLYLSASPREPSFPLTDIASLPVFSARQDIFLWAILIISIGIFLMMMYNFRKSMKECVRTPEEMLEEMASDIELK